MNNRVPSLIFKSEKAGCEHTRAPKHQCPSRHQDSMRLNSQRPRGGCIAVRPCYTIFNRCRPISISLRYSNEAEDKRARNATVCVGEGCRLLSKFCQEGVSGSWKEFLQRSKKKQRR